MGVAAALGRERGRLGLDRDPQLEDPDQLFDRRELRRVDPERPVRAALQDERADALAVSTSPPAWSREIASLTTVRLTP